MLNLLHANAHNLGAVLNNQLSFSLHTANLTQPCRFWLYNIKMIQPFLFMEGNQGLVQSFVILSLDC